LVFGIVVKLGLGSSNHRLVHSALKGREEEKKRRSKNNGLDRRDYGFRQISSDPAGSHSSR